MRGLRWRFAMVARLRLALFIAFAILFAIAGFVFDTHFMRAVLFIWCCSCFRGLTQDGPYLFDKGRWLFFFFIKAYRFD